MKKSDLVVGVEYACFTRPGASKRRYSYETPFRAKLIDVNFVEQRWVRSGGYDGLYAKRAVSGIAVDTGTPVTVKATLGLVDKDKNPVYIDQGRGYGKRRKTREKTYTYDYLLLENAGCFLSTWAEYEAAEAERKSAEQARKDRDLAEREARTAAEPKVGARLKAITARLVELAGPGAEMRYRSYRSWLSKTEPADPDEVFVFVPDEERDDLNTDGEPRMRRVIVGEVAYDSGVGGKEVMTGVKFSCDDKDMALLLGLEA